MKKYIMIPLVMMSFLFGNNLAFGGNGAHKYFSSAASKQKKSVTQKKKTVKSVTKAKNKKNSKVAGVGKKNERSVASVGLSKAKLKKKIKAR